LQVSLVAGQRQNQLAERAAASLWRRPGPISGRIRPGVRTSTGVWTVRPIKRARHLGMSVAHSRCSR